MASGWSLWCGHRTRGRHVPLFGALLAKSTFLFPSLSQLLRAFRRFHRLPLQRLLLLGGNRSTPGKKFRLSLFQLSLPALINVLLAANASKIEGGGCGVIRIVVRRR